MNLNFSELPTHLRRAIILALLGVFVVAVGAFSLSYGAQVDWANQAGLWSTKLTWLFPLLIDLFLLVAELALVVVSGLAYSRAIPVAFMALFACLSIAFNLLHAPPGLAIQITAAMPPVLTICTSVLAATIVKATAKGLGKPLTYVPAAGQVAGPVTGLLGPVPGTIYRPDQPTAYPQPYPPAAVPYALPAAYAQLPSPGQPAALPQQDLGAGVPNPQEHLGLNTQTGRTNEDEQESPYGRAARKVTAYLDGLAERGALNEAVTVRQVAEATGASRNTVQPILAEYKQMLGIPTGTSLRRTRNGNTGTGGDGGAPTADR